MGLNQAEENNVDEKLNIENSLNSESDEEFELAIKSMFFNKEPAVQQETIKSVEHDEQNDNSSKQNDDSNISNSDEIKVSDDTIKIDEADTDISTEEDSEEHSLDIEDESTGENVEDFIEESDEDEQDIETDTENQLDEDEIDYKGFYEKVTAGFKLNGLDIESLKDPDSIIELQKRNLSNNKKNEDFENIKPIIDSLKESGLVEDQDKFGLMMEILNGNVDAIKKLLKEKNIDPYQLDMDEINENSIDSSKYVVSKEELAFKEFVNEANTLGVRNEVADKIIGKWDDESILALVTDENARVRMLEHVKTGMYNKVQAKILSLSNQDPNFVNKADIDKYIIANNTLADEIDARNREIMAKQKADNSESKKVNKKTNKKVSKKEPTKSVEKKPKKEDNAKETEKRIEAAEIASKASLSPSTSTNGNSNVVSLSEIEDDDEFMKAITAMYNL